MDPFKIVEDALGPLLTLGLATVFTGIGYFLRKLGERREWMRQEHYEALVETLKQSQERSMIHQQWRNNHKRRMSLGRTIRRMADDDPELAATQSKLDEADEVWRELNARQVAITTDVTAASAKLRLLGGDALADTAQTLMRVVTETPHDEEATRAAEAAFVELARRRLRTRPRWWERVLSWARRTITWQGESSPIS